MTSRSSRRVVLSFCLLLCSSFSVRAERPEEIRQQLTYMTSALSNGNPADALGPVDKSFKDYARLRDYFVGLTQSYAVTSEITIKDEDDGEGETKLVVEWRLTLTDPSTNFSTQRSADISFTFAPKSGKWKIVDLSPIDLFNPHAARP